MTKVCIDTGFVKIMQREMRFLSTTGPDNYWRPEHFSRNKKGFPLTGKPFMINFKVSGQLLCIHPHVHRTSYTQ